MDAATPANPTPTSAEPADPEAAARGRTVPLGDRLPPEAFLSTEIEIEVAAGGTDPYNHRGRQIASR